jgi:PPM family protein phosphatase
LATHTGQIPIVTKHSTERRAAALLTHKAAPSQPAEGDEAEETTPVRRGWIVPTFLAVMSLLVVAVLWFGYLWTQTQYYVTQFEGRVAIFNGVSQDLGPIHLSRLDTAYNIPLQSLPLYQQQRLDSGIAARDLEHAETIVEELRITSRRNCPEPIPAATASPSASASGKASPKPSPSIPPECIGGTNE